jgi:hypothetical protein
MRKPISFLIAAVVLVGIFFVLKSALPKYAGFLPFIMILILLDVYLWYSVKNKFSSKKPVIKYLVLGLYFLPLMLLVSSILTGVAIPFKEWNIAYRTYLMGIVTIVYVSKFIVIDFLFISDVIRVLQFGFQSLVGKSGKKFNEIRRIRSLVFIGWISGTGFFLLLISGMIFLI